MKTERRMAENLIELRDIVKEFPVKGGLLQRQVATVRAVAGVPARANRRHD